MWWMWIIAAAVVLTSVGLVEHQRAVGHRVADRGRPAKHAAVPGGRRTA